MTASLSGVFSVQEFTDGGLSGAGYRLYTYVTGTTTFKTAYTDAAATVPQTYTSDGLGGQYIALNARGELPAPLFLTTGAYDITLKRPDGSTVWTRQAVPGADASSDAINAINSQLTANAVSWRTGLMIAGNGPWANPASGDPQHLLEVVNDNTAYQCMALNAYGALTNGNNFHWNRYRGTLAVPTAIQSGDYFMSHGCRGWDGTGVLSQSYGAFQYQATENWDSTHHGGRFKFELAKSGGGVPGATRYPGWKLYAGPTDGVIMEIGDETSLTSRILNASTTGALQLHGSQDQTGAQMLLYGAAHATLPNQVWFRDDIVSFQDRSGNETLNINALNQQLLFTGKGGFGYYAGAGAAVTQATDKTTGVTSNTPSTKITMNASSVTGNTAVSFTFTNSKIGADDHVIVTIRGGATAGSYLAMADQISAGSCRISLRNVSAGALAEAVVLQCSVIKGAST